MRRKQALTSLIGFVLVAVLALAYTFRVENSPLLGLDLRGGVSVVLQPVRPAEDSAYETAIDIMNQRINALGVAEPDIHRQADTIVVQIAGLNDADKDKAIALVGQTAKMRFRPVLKNLSPDLASTTPTTAVTPPSSTPSNPGSTPPAVAPTASDPTSTTVAPTSTAPASTTPATPAENGLGTDQVEGESAAGASAAQTPDTVTDTGTATTVVPSTSGADPAAQTSTTLTAEQQQQQQAVINQALEAQQSANAPTDDSDANEQVVVILPDKDPAKQRYELGPVALTGSALEGAAATLDSQTGKWLVNPKFKPGADGIDLFNAIAGKCHAKTAECPTGQLAITLDGEVISAPTIEVASFSADQIQISGDFTEEEARDLATSLKYGALPVELVQQSSQTVSASLGGDALRAGILAGAVGLILVSIYMIAFYRLLGVLAILKLGIEGALLWAFISWLGATAGLTLTLAGVTGIIVSIGVSLDSNVVYYEHLREDVRKGRTVRSAVDRSFASAFSTILKADGASLLGAGLLWWLAVGPVRGFAFYLGLSTVLDLISSYFYMRPVVYLATNSRLCRRRPGLFGLPASAESADSEPVRRPRPSKGTAAGRDGQRPSKRSGGSVEPDDDTEVLVTDGEPDIGDDVEADPATTGAN